MNFILDLSIIKDIANIALTLALTVATVYLAIYTFRLVKEARLSRKSQVQPCIAIHLNQAETDPTLLFIIVQNIGTGMAYDLRFDIQKDIGEFGNGAMKLAQRGLFKEGMKFFPPNFSKKFFLVETMNDYNVKMQEELILKAIYKNIFSEIIEQTFHIRLKEQIMSSSVSPPDTYIGRIADSLNKIRVALEKRE